MTLEEDNSSLSNDRFNLTRGTLPISSTAIPMTSDSHSSTPVNRSEKEGNGFHYCSNRKQAAAKDIPIPYLRYRLCLREFLLTRLYSISLEFFSHLTSFFLEL